MHFSSAFVAAAAAYLLPVANADEASQVSSASSASASPASSAEVGPPKPTFTPYGAVKAPFFEQFTDDWESRWKASHAKKAKTDDTEEEWQFVGNWAVEEPSVLPGMEGDKGLVLKDKAAHHAISAKFPKKIDNKGKDLVVQYEVKLQDGLECGGAYLKLLKDDKSLHQEEFSNASPYVIMFGPDKCGSTDKIHFIFKHKNPKTGEYEEKHMTSPPKIEQTALSALYTLIIKKDQSFHLMLNGEYNKNGTLLEDFSPPVNPEKEIDDPKDKKPDDWVDTAKIKDPDAKKPDDWDEDAPYEIPDEEAEKPEDWLDNEPSMIPDPEAKKPEDWDDEEDGDWEAPTVPNPKCAEASGCGEWTRPTKKNPDYKGKWSAPMIDNPEYKGPWKPRKIANPDYFEDKTPSNLEPMGAVGFELWTMQKDILFDNIYIGHDIEEAKEIRDKTWRPKHDTELAIKKAQNEAEKKEAEKAATSAWKEDPIGFAREKVDLFVTMAKQDFVGAVKFMPEVAGAIGMVLVTALALIIGGLGLGAKSPKAKETAQKAKDTAADAKDKAAEGAATGAEKVQGEVNKRTTRSSAATDGSS
ncbi:MAG: hypothetical protein M1831_000449 [Alyxoria varia]|nr:MAG: hypothetical protein M1831_000449 [Alyxoria varia]